MCYLIDYQAELLTLISKVERGSIATERDQMEIDRAACRYEINMPPINFVQEQMSST